MSKTQQGANSTCLTLGHEWRTTTSTTFRACARIKCRAVEQLVHDTWIDVTPTREQLRKHRPLLPAPTLWDERDLLKAGLHPRQREIEREAERRYVQSIKGGRM